MKIGIIGAGAMGQILKELIEEREKEGEGLVLCGMTEPFGREGLYEEFSPEPEVLIDFSHPANIHKICEYAEEKGIPAVIATTGHSQEEREKILSLSLKTPVILSANYSMGVSVMERVVAELTSILKDDFDIEIIEKHHRRKLDAPSGTALLLARAVNKEGGYEFTYGRYGSQRRKKQEIGIQAVRGGTIVGEHSVIFAGEDEIIEIKHTAGSRRIFAAGALKAAKFAVSSAPGLYTMKDVLWKD